ncbi:hypothetical protein Baya_11725 [Bagarius yarrelli]|uniref:Uncharacterized protein n=1 Tax=Bagarius yarrelli TaxID=175774 RepID=A0A556V1E9_BAGYA|nr:hypothetical protein Baya_11725 [Bagarius yarrelli]
MERKATETDKFLGFTRPLFPQPGVSETPLFNIEGNDDITLHSCPHPIKTMVNLVHNTTERQKLFKGFTKKTAGHQGRNETPKFFHINVKEPQDVTSPETRRSPFIDTLFKLAHPTTKGVFREQQDVGVSVAHFSRLSVTPRQFFKKKEKSERGHNKTPISFHRRTQTPLIHWDHFKDQQEIRFFETRLPPLVDSPVTLDQHTTKTIVTEQQDISVSETPLTVMPSQLFKMQDMSNRGHNKIMNGHHKKKEKPQISLNCIKEKQDRSHLPPLGDTLNNLPQQRTKHSVKEQWDISLFDTHLSPLTVIPCKLFKRTEMSKAGGNKIPNDHHGKTEMPQNSPNKKKQTEVRFSDAHFPPLVGSLFNLAQHTKKRIFREQDMSFFETHYLPFTVTPCKLFKRKEMSKTAGNMMPVSDHKRTNTPQVFWDNFQEQQDVSFSETHHPPLNGDIEHLKYDIN